MEDVVVERRFDQPTDFDNFRGANDKAPGCYDLYRLSYWGSFVSVDGRYFVCHVRAPDAESVRIPSVRYNVPFTAAWSATRDAGSAPLEPPGPKGLVAYLCPETRSNALAEPRPHVVLCVRRAATEMEPQAWTTQLERALGSEHLLVTYRSRDHLRAIAVLHGVTRAAVATAFPNDEIWEARLCTRKLGTSHV